MKRHLFTSTSSQDIVVKLLSEGWQLVSVTCYARETRPTGGRVASYEYNHSPEYTYFLQRPVSFSLLDCILNWFKKDRNEE